MRLILLLTLITALASCDTKTEWQYNKGAAHGTTYSIIYNSPVDMHNKIIDVMTQTDNSLSTYIPTSTISKINLNYPDVELDTLFIEVFDKGKEISEKTQGYFDMTVAPLINIWGFGYESSDNNLLGAIDTILNYVGYDKIERKGNKIVKKHSSVKLDASAIAKGYSVDRVARYLESKKIENYMVEIGGEVRVAGKNPKQQTWRIGIDKPKDSPIISQNRQLESILHLTHGALATSGNYRQYYIKDGKKYAHIVNPKTGYPEQHDLLSVTVWTPDCLTADAYATAFMAMGYNRAREIVDQTDSMEALFIVDLQGNTKVHITKGIEQFMK